MSVTYLPSCIQEGEVEDQEWHLHTAFASLAFLSRTLPFILSHDFGKGWALSDEAPALCDHSYGVRGSPKGFPSSP